MSQVREGSKSHESESAAIADMVEPEEMYRRHKRSMHKLADTVVRQVDADPELPMYKRMAVVTKDTLLHLCELLFDIFVDHNLPEDFEEETEEEEDSYEEDTDEEEEPTEITEEESETVQYSEEDESVSDEVVLVYDTESEEGEESPKEEKSHRRRRRK
jgi:hypothetical protein